VVDNFFNINHCIDMKEIKKKDRLLIKIGKKVAEYRKERELSQEELGFMITSARNYIGCIERGEKSPSIRTLYKISKALKVKTKDLIDF
jgi:transcriptional regulator with XRE-family HTH domain